MSHPKPGHELTVRRQRPEDDEPDRVPLSWALVRRMIGLTAGYRTWRNRPRVLCAGRATSSANACSGTCATA